MASELQTAQLYVYVFSGMTQGALTLEDLVKKGFFILKSIDKPNVDSWWTQTKITTKNKPLTTTQPLQHNNDMKVGS